MKQEEPVPFCGAWTGTYTATSCVVMPPGGTSGANCQVGVQSWATITAPALANYPESMGTKTCSGAPVVTTIVSGASITISSQSAYTRGAAVYSCTNGTLAKVSGSCDFVSECWFQTCSTMVDNSAQGWHVQCPDHRSSGKTVAECKTYCDMNRNLELAGSNHATYPNSKDRYQCFYSGSGQPTGYPSDRP